MISDYRFFKSLTCLNVSEKIKRDCYAHTIDMLAESHKKEINWQKIIDIEEKYQWPILGLLGDPGLKFYENVEEISKQAFFNLIREEKKLRQRAKNMPKPEYEKELIRIIKKRIEFFEQMLGITEHDIEDFKKGKWKWWLALAGIGAVSVMGFYGVRKIAKKKGKEHKK